MRAETRVPWGRKHSRERMVARSSRTTLCFVRQVVKTIVWMVGCRDVAVVAVVGGDEGDAAVVLSWRSDTETGFTPSRPAVPLVTVVPAVPVVPLVRPVSQREVLVAGSREFIAVLRRGVFAMIGG